MSKILEKVIYSRIKPYLSTSCNQFGFKPNVGTELRVFTLKEYLNYYHKLGSQMFVCFWMPQQHSIELNLLGFFKN